MAPASICGSELHSHMNAIVADKVAGTDCFGLSEKTNMREQRTAEIRRKAPKLQPHPQEVLRFDERDQQHCSDQDEWHHQNK